MAEREVLLFLLVQLLVSSGHADEELFVSPNETNIVAYVNEKAVLPCRPTSSQVNMTLYKGELSWSMRRIYLGKQPLRNLMVTFDPEVGFILDPVTAMDSNTYRCRASVEDLDNSSYSSYETRYSWLSPDYMKFTLDVNTGHLLVTPSNNTIIVKEGTDAVLPCKAVDKSTNVKLYKESVQGFELMQPGKILHPLERLYGSDDDDSDNDDDTDEHDDDDDDNNDGEDKHSLKTDDEKGFIITAIEYSDDDTYKCVATKQNQKEVMYFYVHVDENHILRGNAERHVIVYKDKDLVLPCTPTNPNVTVRLFHISSREILVGPASKFNRTVTYDPNVGFTLTGANVSDSGSYRCDATLRRHRESAFFYVYVNDEQLLQPVDDTNIHPRGSGNTVIPCIPKKSGVKVELYREIAPMLHRLVTRRRHYYGYSAVYSSRKGFTVYYSSYMSSEHLLCVAQLGQKRDTLFFYWHGENLLLHPSSRIIVADSGNKAVVPCKPSDADIEVTLYIGSSYFKRREIKMGQQPHRNQNVTFDPEVGFTFFPVNHVDSSWYKCVAKSDTVSQVMNFYLEVRVPARITHTNLHVNKSLVQIAGQNMTMLCKSDGMPYPDTFWYKDGKPVVIGTSYELRDRNQSLIIKLLKPEHGGTYSCVVRNEVGVVKAEGAVTITDGPPFITRTSLNKTQNVVTKLKGTLTIFCESQGKPEPETVWYKDGKPVITDASVELGERNQSLTIKVVSVDHIGLYCCKVSNINGQVESEGTVTLADMESVSVTETNLNVTTNIEAKVGESLVLYCNSQGKPEPKTNWFKDGQPVVPDNSTVTMSHRNQELLIIPVKLEHEGTYRCVAENGLTEAYMEGKVAVNEPAKIIETNMNVSRNIAAEIGTDLMIFCKSEGSPVPHITWFKDDKPLDIDSTVELMDNNQTLVIKGVKQEAGGMYRCVVQNQLAAVQMAAVVNVSDDSANSTTVVVASVAGVLVLLALIAAIMFYVRRGRLFYSLWQYMQLERPRQDTEDHSDFSDRLQDEYFGSPRLYGGDNDVGNLIVSECLPETSRPALDASDNYRNINSVNRSTEISDVPSHASGVRFVEMKSA